MRTEKLLKSSFMMWMDQACGVCLAHAVAQELHASYSSFWGECITHSALRACWTTLVLTRSFDAPCKPGSNKLALTTAHKLFDRLLPAAWAISSQASLMYALQGRLLMTCMQGLSSTWTPPPPPPPRVGRFRIMMHQCRTTSMMLPSGEIIANTSLPAPLCCTPCASAPQDHAARLEGHCESTPLLCMAARGAEF